MGIKSFSKAHILEVHVPEFFERQKSLGNGAKGLGFYAEQASEAVHGKWKKMWEKYMTDMDHPDYDKQLKKCGMKFHSLNM